MVEKINVKDTGISRWEDSDDFKHIDEKQIDFDSEKGSVEYEIVIQRKSDGKLFIFTYTDGGHSWNDFEDQMAYEAVREEVKVYVYKKK